MIVVHKAGALSHSQDFLNPHPPIFFLTYLRIFTQNLHVAPYKRNLELRRLQDAISQVGIRYRRWNISSGSSISHLQWSIRKRKLAPGPDNQYKGSTAVYCLFVFCLFLCLFLLCCCIICAFLTNEQHRQDQQGKQQLFVFLFWLLVCVRSSGSLLLTLRRDQQNQQTHQLVSSDVSCPRMFQVSDIFWTDFIKWLPSKTYPC